MVSGYGLLQAINLMRSVHFPVISHSWPQHEVTLHACSLQERALLTPNVGICSDSSAGLGLGSLEQMQSFCMVQHPKPGANVLALVPPLADQGLLHYLCGYDCSIEPENVMHS